MTRPGRSGLSGPFRSGAGVGVCAMGWWAVGDRAGEPGPGGRGGGPGAQPWLPLASPGAPWFPWPVRSVGPARPPVRSLRPALGRAGVGVWD